MGRTLVSCLGSNAEFRVVERANTTLYIAGMGMKGAGYDKEINQYAELWEGRLAVKCRSLVQ